MAPILVQRLFALSPELRYVAVRAGASLLLEQRPGIRAASASESDRYEELIVNPTLLVLVQQRGNIDCGGVKYVLVRYGNFWAVVVPTPQGHVAVALEPSVVGLERIVESIAQLILEGGTDPAASLPAS
jgi:hypothetical protein